MNTRRPIDTDAELVAAIGDVFDQINAPETQEDIDMFLREAGHDPGAVGRGTAAFVDDLIRAVRGTVIQERRKGLEDFGRRATQLELPQTRVGLIEAIRAFVSCRGTELATQFRNFEKQTDEDLRQLLTELMAMERAPNEKE